MPIAAMAMREVVGERPLYILGSLAPLAVFYALPVGVTGINGGETERTWLYTYPLVAVAAGATFARWERARGRASPWIFAVLFLAGALQAILIEALYDMFW